MGRIAWIEDAVSEFDDDRLRALVDASEAVQIASDEDLGIENPSLRVSDFVESLPSLFAWFGSHYRDFPWRRTHDPWEVIVAETLLQRTRAAKVEEIYRPFLARFPDPESIVVADRDEVYGTVEALGFGNKRTTTLKTLAETIIEEYDGEVPNDLDSLLDLPRIGPYTARACLCFAYGRPLALVDANIETVVEHTFGYSSQRRAHKDRALYSFLDALIPQQSNAARIFNLALLDLRVLVCATDLENQQCPLENACRYVGSVSN